jgi:hypothetical protein
MYRKHMTMRGCAPHRDEAEASGSGGRLRIAKALACLSLFVAVVGYLFSVNRNAVAGYSMRAVEKRMIELSNESQRLRIREAELRSLYGLEEASSRLDMKPIEGAISLEEPGTVAYGK